MPKPGDEILNLILCEQILVDASKHPVVLSS